MREHPINDLLNISLDSIIRMVDTSKIVGTPIDLGNNRFIIPISKVSFGFGAGGSEFSNSKNDKKKNLFNSETSDELFPFGGGSGGGRKRAGSWTNIGKHCRGKWNRKK